MNLRKPLSAMTLLLSLPAYAQDRLPVVEGALLIQASDPAACLAGVGDDAPFATVLNRAARDIEGLRAVSFEWNTLTDAQRLLSASADRQGLDLRSDLDDEMESAERLEEWLDQSPDMTVHTYPDGTIIPDLAQCQNDNVAAAPQQTATTGRAWFLPVSGGNASGELNVPQAFSEYIAALPPDQVAGKHLSACVLLGGGLTLQPALAAELVAPVADDLEEILAATEIPSTLDIRMARGLLTPLPIHWRGWDAVLLVESLDEDPGASACEEVYYELLGDADAPDPSLGANPTNTVPDCPAEGLMPGQTLRNGFLFGRVDDTPGASGRSRTRINAEEADVISAAMACVAQTRAAGTEVQIHIEGYASVDSGSETNRAFSDRRASAVRARVDIELDARGLCDNDRCPGVQITSVGFGETEMFSARQNDPDLIDNRVAYLSVTAVEELRPLVSKAPIDTAIAQFYLGHTTGTCQPPTDRPASRARDLMAFLTSEFGETLIKQVDPPEMILMLHNQTGADAQRRLARSLQEATSRSASCSRDGAPARVGYIYRRTGPAFEGGQVVSGSEREDYFILPPKLTWIFPVPDAETEPDLEALPALRDQFGLVSGNGTNFDRLADVSERAYRRERLSLVETLTINQPVPLDEVLRALGNAELGTGWVGLTSGWD